MLDALVLRAREVNGVVDASLRISAPPQLLNEMIDEFIARNGVPVVGDNAVSFGHVRVVVDDSLPPYTFRIDKLEDVDLGSTTGDEL